MAIVTKVSTVCDRCRNPKRRIKTYRVNSGDQAVVLLLCFEHRKEIEDLIKIGTPVDLPRRPGPPVKLWEMSEIEDNKNGK